MLILPERTHSSLPVGPIHHREIVEIESRWGSVHPVEDEDVAELHARGVGAFGDRNERIPVG